ncbi:MAG: SPOR domain-containing protein [Rhodospirillaceae bacterium]|nr:SPOR domain-containing protein [Rhodospirillaceae bacterium]MBL6930985.1 SPOR domain-containing protein [Rhodospirillales bacterium]MBL6941908.1 SPOR domain-containing protein [Rhodospirillales bacterium]
MVPSDEPEDEIVPDPSDALEFQRVKRAKPKRRGLWLLMLMVLIGSSAGAGWFYYGDQLMGKDKDNLPVIHAAEGPVKVRPKTPGGMSIPDRDKLVYDRMNGNVPEPRIERLLPMPEMPKTPQAPVAEAKADVEVQKPKLLAKPQKLEPGKVELKKEPEKTPEPAVTVNDDMMPEPLAPEQSKTETPTPTPPPPAATSVSRLAYQIQIAAVRSHERAESEWERLKKKHGDLLGGYTLNIIRADLGADKGIFFRLRAGPIAGEDVAQALCENLSKRKVGCLIVRPGG